MTKLQKTINVLIDNIDPLRGIKGNISNDDDTFYTMEAIFPEANINYHASGTLLCKNKLIDNWVYPIIIHNLTFINFMFDWGAGNKDIIGLLPPRVQRLYLEGRGTIVVIIKEPLQTMHPDNDDLQNFIRMIEENPRYKNILFLTLHYIDSPNFIFTNVIENTMKDFVPVTSIAWEYKEQKCEYLEDYKSRRFLCLLVNYKESSERLALIKFLEQHKLLNKGFVSAPDYPSAEIFKELDIMSGFNKSLLNIIPEGNFDRRGYHFITEKSYRSFLHKKPFIYLGQYEGLKFIRSMGYKTFSPIINESYDNIDNDKLRAATVCKEIKRLVDKPIEDFVKDMSQLQDICEHNYKVYVSSKANFKDKFYKKIYGTNNANFKN